MVTPDIDPLAREFRATQAVRELDRMVRGVLLCGCGKEYTDDVAGRHAHKVLIGHAPSGAVGS